MTRKKSQSHLLDPVYLLVGATEATASALRGLGAKKRSDDEGDKPESTEPTPALSRLRGDAVDLARGVVRVPGLAMGEALKGYAELTGRGRETVSGAVPFARRATEETDLLARAEQARARREARRVARQAGATVERGRSFASNAAESTSKAAERTLEVVRAEAGQVMEAVSHPGRGSGRPVGRAPARRRAAVVDTAVAATNPSGGETDTTDKADRAPASGVEAGASAARRPARARRTPGVSRRPGRRPSPSASSDQATASEGAASTTKAGEGNTAPKPAVRSTGTKRASSAQTAAKKSAAKSAAKKSGAKKAAATKSTAKKTAKSGARKSAQATATTTSTASEQS